MCFLKKVDKIAKLSRFYTFKPCKISCNGGFELMYFKSHMVYIFLQNEKKSELCQLYANLKSFDLEIWTLLGYFSQPLFEIFVG